MSKLFERVVRPAKYLGLPDKDYAIYRDEGYRRALKAAQDWFVTHLQGSKQ